jgi:GNAT superfamily N-acetyltransferase
VTFDDLDAVERLLIDVDASSFGEAESSRIWLEEAWSSDWTDLPTMSRLLIAADDSVAGYADLEAVDPAKEIGVFARVHPGHVRRGLGAALVGWTRWAAARMVAPGRSVTLRHSIAGPDRAARRLLEREGFEHVRTAWHMRMDLPPGFAAGDPPPGVTIRPSIAGDDDLEIWETMEAAFRTHFGFQPVGFEQWWTTRDAPARTTRPSSSWRSSTAGSSARRISSSRPVDPAGSGTSPFGQSCRDGGSARRCCGTRSPISLVAGSGRHSSTSTRRTRRAPWSCTDRSACAFAENGSIWTGRSGGSVRSRLLA